MRSSPCDEKVDTPSPLTQSASLNDFLLSPQVESECHLCCDRAAMGIDTSLVACALMTTRSAEAYAQDRSRGCLLSRDDDDLQPDCRTASCRNGVRSSSASIQDRSSRRSRRSPFPVIWMAVLAVSACLSATPAHGFSHVRPVSSSSSSSTAIPTPLKRTRHALARRTTSRTSSSLEASSSDKHEQNGADDRRRVERRAPRRRQAQASRQSSLEQPQNSTMNGASTNGAVASFDAMQRIVQLEELVAKQAVEIKRLQEETKNLHQAVDAFASVVEVLREAGLSERKDKSVDDDKKEEKKQPTKLSVPIVDSLQDDAEIFGEAPSSVMDAADAAGGAVLAGLLAGKRRLLVDVRDAELTNPEVLAQFLELSVLPVAAGLEGLQSKRNRLKIVFPKVSQLLEYRKNMALAAPDVVSLSTMDFDPIEANDNLVVMLAPNPDDTQGVQAMEALLDPKSGITQPVVVLNPHMAPPPSSVSDFMVAYQLRLYTVHYRAKFDDPSSASDSASSNSPLEAAMQHAKEVSRNPSEHEGKTRAMVIRAYPRPWNVFLDTSPDTAADFVVAATFETEPTAEMVQKSVVDCLQGSEEEDELVAQQMQQALEAGQLDRVSELLGDMGFDFFDDEDEDDEDEDDLWRLQDVDTV